MCSKILFYSEHHLYHIAYRDLHFITGTDMGIIKICCPLMITQPKAKVLLNQNTIDIKRPLADY